MGKVREILRLKLGVWLSVWNVAKSCKVGKTTVLEYEKRFREAGLSWPLPEDVDNSVLEHVVRARLNEGKHRRELPETAYLISETRKAHVTLHLLWLEYRECCPNRYGYTQFCHYYNQAKAKVEVGVQVVERWILAALRNRVFFSLGEINDAIAELLDRLNSREFKNIDSTRAELFERLDRSALAPLPQDRYQYAEWRSAKANLGLIDAYGLEAVAAACAEALAAMITRGGSIFGAHGGSIFSAG